jgi:hypothetical protein
MNKDEAEMCADLKKLVDSASINFVDITQGHRTDHSAFASFRLPSATSCFISTTSTAAYECHFPTSYRDKLIKSMSACFPDADKSGSGDLTTFFLKLNGNPSFDLLRDKDILLQIEATKR